MQTNNAAEQPIQEQPSQAKPGRKKKDKPKKTVKQEIMSWVWTLLAALVIATLIRMFVFEPIRVDGGSMNNTLADGEIVFVSKLDYEFGQMKRNDVVICRYPGRTGGSINFGAALSLDSYTLFVKRLVALPGDTVEISAGKLYVNGLVVEDPAFMGSVPRDFARITLGQDQYFVMGDNRYTSHDSRADDVGPISKSAIMGHVRCVLFPFNKIRGVE